MRRSRRWETTLCSPPTLVEALRKDAADESSKHDMGGNIMPMMVDRGMAQVYDFQRNEVPGADPAGDAGYWRDVGTLDSYYDAHMDLCARKPVFNLYNSEWPILTHIPPHPPAKSAMAATGLAMRSTAWSPTASSSLGALRESVLSPGVRVEDYATERSVIMDNTVIGANAVVQNAIIDKDVVVPEGAQVGVDKDHDRARGFVVPGRRDRRRQEPGGHFVSQPNQTGDRLCAVTGVPVAALNSATTASYPGKLRYTQRPSARALRFKRSVHFPILETAFRSTNRRLRGSDVRGIKPRTTWNECVPWAHCRSVTLTCRLPG